RAKTHQALVESAIRAPRAALLYRHGVRIALNLRGEQFIDAEPAGPANVGGTRLACAGLSFLHIAALISPPFPQADRCVRIIIDKGSAFAVNEDHSSYDDAAQVAFNQPL